MIFGSEDEDSEGATSKPKRKLPCFDEDDEEDEKKAHGKKSKKEEEEDEEEDTLDAFMTNLESQKGKEKSQGVSGDPPKPLSGRDVWEEKDDHEVLFEKIQQKKLKLVTGGEDEGAKEIEYDSDDNPIIPQHQKEIVPLEPVDHTKIHYPDIYKDFYEEHPDIAVLSAEQVKSLRSHLGITATGAAPIPNPVCSFAHFGFDPYLLALVKKLGFEKPTPVQAQCVPALLQGRDVIGIAKTGSGKTAAFLWPLVTHLQGNDVAEPLGQPHAIVCVPTRELAQQVYGEAKRVARLFDLRVVAVYGGESKWEQTQAIRAGADIVIATPGRLIDLVKTKILYLQKVSFLVLDEADRMFDLGFEPQVKSIVANVRPDCQIALFSATFKKSVEALARNSLTDPVRILAGVAGEANADIEQNIIVVDSEAEKWEILKQNIVRWCSAGSVLIFVTKKTSCEVLADRLRLHCGRGDIGGNDNSNVVWINGDMNQSDRNVAIGHFKKQRARVLVATDVAARGLDIASVRTVVNYECARDIDTHVHRIGRTGRAGLSGEAVTFVLRGMEVRMAGDLAQQLRDSGKRVPDMLERMVQRSRGGRQGWGGGRGVRGRGGERRGRGRGRGRGSSSKEGGALHVNPNNTPLGGGADGGYRRVYSTNHHRRGGARDGRGASHYQPQPHHQYHQSRRGSGRGGQTM
eukprot:Nk52_evm5s278 gene=Nk52_evmTU5s278